MALRKRRPGSWIRFAAFAALQASGVICAQQSSSPQAQGPTLRVTTNLVLVDVTAADAKGKPILDLKPEDFTVLESGVPQKISTFSLEQPQPAGAPAVAGRQPLPQNVFTNRPEYQDHSGSVSVLLLDTLNTPFADAAWAQQAIGQYLKSHPRLAQPTAAFALGPSLVLLHDFTDDAGALNKAISAYRPLPSHLLEMEDLSTCVSFSSSPTSRSARAAMGGRREMCATRADAAREARVETTLAALRVVSRAFAGLSSRKNLLWISASFPLLVTAAQDPYRKSPPVSYAGRLRETARLMVDARIAVYPIDARGLVGALVLSASDSGIDPMTGRARSFADRVSSSAAALAATQDTMEEVARETGGRAFRNSNDLEGALESSLADSSYYLLGYYPADKARDGKFRRIEVKVARPGLQVRHRRGYYATDPAAPSVPSKGSDELPDTLMMNGLPPATMVLFDAEVVPPDFKQNNRVVIRFLVDAGSLSAEEMPDGSSRFALEVRAVVTTETGTIAFAAREQGTTTIQAANLAAAERNGLPYRAALDLAPGDYQLHLAVRDTRSGAFGTLNVPLTILSPTQVETH